MGTVVVGRGRAKPLWQGHPWVFADSVDSVEGEPAPGDCVTVVDERRRVIGCGYFSPRSKIAVRILSNREALDDEASLLRDRLERAVALRREVLDLPAVTDAYRLVHSEGDRLPGLVVDHLAGCLVVQFSTIGMHRRRKMLLELLEELVAPHAVFEQPDRKAAALEGLDLRAGLLSGEAPSGPFTIREFDVRYRLIPGKGQKTGFFADQRDNRRAVGALARDRRVLDLFTFTGGFALHAAAGGAADVLGIDSSAPVLALAKENARLNGFAQVRFQRGNAKAALNEMHREGLRFDLVICDPPRFARDRAGADRALRAYRDLHLRALRLVEPDGLIALSSCSGAVGEEPFERTVREAAYDVGCSVQVLYRGGQGPDHPVLATCPEGRYLKFLFGRVSRIQRR